MIRLLAVITLPTLMVLKPLCQLIAVLQGTPATIRPQMARWQPHMYHHITVIPAVITATQAVIMVIQAVIMATPAHTCGQPCFSGQAITEDITADAATIAVGVATITVVVGTTVEAAHALRRVEVEEAVHALHRVEVEVGVHADELVSNKKPGNARFFCAEYFR